MIQRLLGLPAAVALLLCVVAPPASAHTELRSASPAKGSTVSSPAEIVLTFNDPVRLPQVVVTDAAGDRQVQGAARAVDNKVTQTVSGPLGPGTYTVGWRVVASDGHPLSGTYRFTVEGTAQSGAPVQPSVPAPAASPAAGSGDGGGGAGWLWVGLAALLIAALAGGGALLRRRSAGRPG
jgi:copper resistance protein C